MGVTEVYGRLEVNWIKGSTSRKILMKIRRYTKHSAPLKLICFADQDMDKSLNFSTTLPPYVMGSMAEQGVKDHLSAWKKVHTESFLGCVKTKVPLLVYEYICNGTLSHHLHGGFRPVPSDGSRIPTVTLSLEHRLRIAREIAGALSYLHSCASSAIFHRDTKSSNILLDENYRAVVSDFGLSRLVSIEKTHLTTQVGGTFGYLDPEYFRSGQLNDKSDVYAFGVVLLELLTSRKSVSSDSSSSEVLAMSFKSMFKQSRLLEMVDPHIARDVEGQELVPIVAKLAKRCLKSSGRNRPSMKVVAAELDELTVTRSYDKPHVDSFQENISLKSESLYSYSSDSLIEEN
ncbi:hypothetical protein RND71_036994 [Anisodus tanguticus]|uniref:Protein kinase domain-containing protein n=1 Tax=Anisodus tanguticus TaxID=243964 RepID=A0AAE1V0V2_9SOLA|nr:hypothetical protein RND71_036994 [Anisodus tanguticus]